MAQEDRNEEEKPKLSRRIPRRLEGSLIHQQLLQQREQRTEPEAREPEDPSHSWRAILT